MLHAKGALPLIVVTSHLPKPGSATVHHLGDHPLLGPCLVAVVATTGETSPASSSGCSATYEGPSPPRTTTPAPSLPWFWVVGLADIAARPTNPLKGGGPPAERRGGLPADHLQRFQCLVS